MSATFPADVLDLFRTEIEVDIETVRAFGAPRRTTIWIVVVDGVTYVRSWKGPAGRWYREVLVEPDAVIHVLGRRVPARAIPADEPASIEACSRGLNEKYKGDPSTASMLADAVLPTTLRLEPAD